MKRSILFILVLFIVHANYIMAADDIFTTTIDGFTYFHYEPRSVTVTGTSLSGDIVIPSSITYNGNTYTVTKISNFCTEADKTVTSVTIPSTISSISSGAFGISDALKNITVDTDNQWLTSDDGILYNKDKTKLIYYPCKKDASHFTIPASVTTLSGEAFSRNSTLTSIVIPKTVETIGDGNDDNNYTFHWGTFYKCDKLTSVTFEDDCKLTKIPRNFLGECTSLTNVNIPDQVTIIGGHAFHSCSSLTSILIPKAVTTIGNSAFGACSSLSTTIIPESVTSIGEEAFYNCRKLITKLPSQLKYLGNYAFERCNSLTEIEFPKTLTSSQWDGGWFAYCSNLRKIVIPEDCELDRIPDYCFREDIALTDVTLSNNIKIIGSYAFGGCEKLERINLPENLTTIYSHAFESCSCLKDVTCHDKLETIGDDAFSHCMRLENINLPNSLKTIGARAFADNSNLKNINLPKSLKTVGGAAFSSTSCTTITIPASVTSFSSSALMDTRDLQEIKVAEGNTAYTSIDGVLFTKDKKTLVTYPIGSDRRVAYKVPYGVETIDEWAFCDSKLTHVTLPSTLKTISEGAFWDSPLRELTIPASVTKIEARNLSDKVIYLLNSTQAPVLENVNWLIISHRYFTIYVKPSAYANKVYQNADGWKEFPNSIKYQIPVIIPASGMMSMSRDFDVDLSSSNLTAYVAQGVSDGKACKQVNMVPIAVSGKTDGKYVPSRMGTITDNGVEYEKYEGVILKGEPGSTVYYTIGEDDDAVTEQTNYLVPATDATKVTMTEEKNGVAYTNLGLKNGAFRYFIADGTIPYKKCWLSLPTSIVGTYDSQSGAKALSMNFTDNEATAIRGLTYPTYSDGAYYTLQGVRVSHPEHGIFIHNGKKVILK